jgi:hypothetical protein
VFVITIPVIVPANALSDVSVFCPYAITVPFPITFCWKSSGAKNNTKLVSLHIIVPGF